MDEKHKCPVCGQTEFDSIGSYDICDVCGWEDDPYQEEHPEDDVGANELSLIDYRKAYENGVIIKAIDSEEDDD